MKKTLLSLITLFFSIGCNPIGKTHNIRVWTPVQYDLCEANVIVSSLPFDIGVNLNVSNLPTRYDSSNSNRAHVLLKDGTDTMPGNEYVTIFGQMSTAFTSWSNDGNKFVIAKGWEDPQWAMREEYYENFLFNPNLQRSDNFVMDLNTMTGFNVTAVEEVSYSNGGATFFPGDDSRMTFSAIIGNENRLFTMNADGTNKQPSVSTSGFSYGYSISPDGTKYSFHSNYQIYIGDMITHQEIHVDTPCAFNFGPSWSPDSSKIMFSCGANNNSPDLYVANRDGSNAHFIASKNGFVGTVPFYDGYDYHGGGTDWIAWSKDSQSIFMAQGAEDGKVEMFKVNVNTAVNIRLTISSPGVWNNFPNVSPDGDWLLFSSTQAGARNLHMINLNTLENTQITNLRPDCMARYGQWNKQ